MRREHYVAAAYAPPSASDPDLSNHMHRSKQEFLAKGIVTSKPPPKREVVLVLNIQEYGQFFSSSLENVFGFVFDKTLFLETQNLRIIEFCNELDGLVARLIYENKIIKHYGIYLAFYTGVASSELLSQLFSFLQDWCTRAGRERDVEIDFDIFQDPTELTFLLKNELFKIVHGDMKAQFSAAMK